MVFIAESISEACKSKTLKPIKVALIGGCTIAAFMLPIYAVAALFRRS